MEPERRGSREPGPPAVDVSDLALVARRQELGLDGLGRGGVGRDDRQGHRARVPGPEPPRARLRRRTLHGLASRGLRGGLRRGRLLRGALPSSRRPSSGPPSSERPSSSAPPSSVRPSSSRPPSSQPSSPASRRLLRGGLLRARLGLGGHLPRLRHDQLLSTTSRVRSSRSRRRQPACPGGMPSTVTTLVVHARSCASINASAARRIPENATPAPCRGRSPTRPRASGGSRG